MDLLVFAFVLAVLIALLGVPELGGYGLLIRNLVAPPTNSGRRVARVPTYGTFFKTAWLGFVGLCGLELGFMGEYLGLHRCTNRFNHFSAALISSFRTEFLTGYNRSLRSQSGMTMKHNHGQLFADAATRVASFVGQIIYALPTGASRPGGV